MEKPDVTDFEICRRIIVKIVQICTEHRNILAANKSISDDEYKKLGELIEEPLLQQHNQYTLKIFDGIIKVLDPHLEKIQNVTQQLDTVIDKLEKFKNNLDFLTKIVNFFGDILSVASKGVAGIPDIFSGLEAIMG